MRSKPPFTTLLIAACALSTGASTVFAHDGHGLMGSHWHSTDVLGFVVVGGLAAAAIWLSGRGK
jgi:hypothetical protein